MTTVSLILTALFLAPADPGQSPSPAQAIPSAQAKDNVGRRCTVAMTVQSSRDVKASRVYFLNSETDYKAPNNLALVIEYADAKAFKEKGIEVPSDYYRDKKIQVTGVIVSERDQTRIRLTEPSQIKVMAK